MITHWSLGLFVLTHIQSCISAVTVSNHTIDDDNSDPVTGLVPIYAPPKSWNRVNDDCNVCSIRPDPNQVMDHTWHDTTAHTDSPSSVTMTFTGTAIYVFGIVPNIIPRNVGAASRTVNLAFTLDGAVAEPGYLHLPDNSSGFEYNVPMFVAEGLRNVSHTLVVRTASSPSVFQFDYALYT
ncbi:hypothetical protein B0H13DRAFT_1612026 [Mycena leptocephala]|nr:hypothetical protein B0H13DRAFT_1612026 [Mycena leptocephala]